MFSRIRAELGIKKAALVIPQRAVTETQGKYMVAVVNSDSKVSIKAVKVGERFEQLWVINEGLQVGEKVVAEGTQKVREDMVVSPKPFVAEAQEEPKAAQKPEVKPEAKPQSKPEKR
jgi:membrane fusion protein (multidrug efflux system)